MSNTPSPRAMIRAIKNNGVDPLSQDDLPTWVKRFTTVLLATARAKGFYQQLRFLCKGQEVVRVDYEDNRVKTVSGKKLQDKSGSDYILEAIKLQEGEVYISELNLNREHGKIQVPHTPIIRFSTPVFARGIPMPGVVVLNVYASSFLNNLKLGSGEIKFSNEAGYFLYHPETYKTFGFELGHEIKIFNDLPEARSHFKDKKSEFFTDFVENKVVSLQKIHFDPLKPERYWLVSRVFSAEKILKSITELQWQIFVIMLMALPMVFLLAAFLARGISRPLSQAVYIANQISMGNLNVDVPFTTKNDEPSRLLKALKGMAQSLYEKDKALQTSKQHFESILAIAGKRHHFNQW